MNVYLLRHKEDFTVIGVFTSDKTVSSHHHVELAVRGYTLTAFPAVIQVRDSAELDAAILAMGML
jgi:hypothetical protein